MTIGSTISPVTMWTSARPPATKSTAWNSWNCKSANTDGTTVAVIEPIFGM
ncbi:hypothetical protein D3C83_319900 [compost metagenome]